MVAGGATLLFGEPVEQGLLGAEGFSLCFGECGTALQVSCGEGLEGVLCLGPSADVSEGDAHMGENTSSGA